MKSILLKLLTFSITLSLFLAGCGSTKEQMLVKEPLKEGHETVVEPTNEDSKNTVESEASNVPENIYDTLISTTETGNTGKTSIQKTEETETAANTDSIEIQAEQLAKELNLNKEDSDRLLEELQLIAKLSNGDEDEYNVLIEELVLDYAQEGKTIDIAVSTNTGNTSNTTAVKDPSAGAKALEQEKQNLLAALAGGNGGASNSNSNSNAGNATASTPDKVTNAAGNTNTNTNETTESTSNTEQSSTDDTATPELTPDTSVQPSVEVTPAPTPVPTPEPTPELTPAPEVHTCAFAWETSGDTRIMKCSCGTTGITEYCYNGLWGYYDDSEANDLWDRVNNSRSNTQYTVRDEDGNLLGMEVVPALSRTLDATAKQRAVEVAVNYSHDGCTTANECLAQGQGSALYAHDGWLNSQTHHHAMISAQYTTGGVACFWYDSNNSGENLTPIWVLSLNE